jgi:hypothetical protein
MTTLRLLAALAGVAYWSVVCACFKARVFFHIGLIMLWYQISYADTKRQFERYAILREQGCDEED